MIAMVLAVQIVLPLGQIAWLAILPAGSLAGFALQVASAGAFLCALARDAQWAAPVWWPPCVYGVFWLAAVLSCVLRHSSTCRRIPDGARDPLGMSGRHLVDHPARPRRMVWREGTGRSASAPGRSRRHRQLLWAGTLLRWT